MQNINIGLPSGINNVELEIRNHNSTFFYFYLVHTPTGRRESITADIGGAIYLEAKKFIAKIAQPTSAAA